MWQKIDKDISNKTNTWGMPKQNNDRGGGQTKERRERTKDNHEKLRETGVKENKWHPESLLWQVISSRRSKQMEKRERESVPKSFSCKRAQDSDEGSLVQQQVKTSNSDPKQQHTQSHDAATGRKTRCVCLFLFVCLSQISLLHYVSFSCLNMFVFLCYLFMYVSVWLCETVQCDVVRVFPLGLEFHLLSACLSVV